MKAGCGRFSRKVTSSSALTTTSSRLPYQALRGLTRRLSPLLPLPARRSQVHLTSRAVNGLPSCHLTPERSLKLRRGAPPAPPPPGAGAGGGALPPPFLPARGGPPRSCEATLHRRRR